DRIAASVCHIGERTGGGRTLGQEEHSDRGEPLRHHLRASVRADADRAAVQPPLGLHEGQMHRAVSTIPECQIAKESEKFSVHPARATPATDDLAARRVQRRSSATQLPRDRRGRCWAQASPPAPASTIRRYALPATRICTPAYLIPGPAL